MAVMEFYRDNLIDTTTSVKVDAANTGTVAYLFDNNKKVSFSTSGYNSTTATVISVELPTNTVVSGVFLLNHNVKSYTLFCNSITASSLGSSTDNSATSTYFSFASTTVNSIQIQVNDTIPGSKEKSIGELVVTERLYQFERNPDIADFKYYLDRKQIRHVMPDGGVSLFNIRDKYKATIKCEFFSSTSHDTLYSIYDDALPLYFVPEPTTTGWNGAAYSCVWSGKWDFKYATNGKQAGYTGSINLEEAPGA